MFDSEQLLCAHGRARDLMCKNNCQQLLGVVFKQEQCYQRATPIFFRLVETKCAKQKVVRNYLRSFSQKKEVD